MPSVLHRNMISYSIEYFNLIYLFMDALDCDTSLANASAVFNYSKSMMAIYHSKGFHIYHQEKSLYQRITPFGINHFSFVFDTNVFVLVPNQRKGKYNVSTIVIWDEDAGQEMHIRDTHKPIHHIAHVKEYIAVASLDRIALYNLNKDGPLRYISIGVRQPALAGSLNYHTFLVVFPYAGNVACVSFASPMGGPFPLRSTQQCDPIDQIAVSYSGEYVACSYRKLSGTSRKEIKIYSTV